MSIKLEKEIVELINNHDTIKVLVTLDEKGDAHAVVKNSIGISGDGKLVYLELLESSKSYRNFTRSLWFNREVSVLVVGKKGVSYQVKGVPEKIYVSGPVFEMHYKSIRERLGDVDLAAVCIIKPGEIIDESFSAHFEEQEKNKPIFKHLDRLAK